MQKLPSLVLASQSPRRKQILESLGIAFQAVHPKEDKEKHPAVSEVVEVTNFNALVKAEGLLADYSSETIVIGCDTLVVLEKQVLGKPSNKDEAASMLKTLSGRTHTVVSGLALLSKNLGKKTIATQTKVTFRKITNLEIEEYTRTKEPYDKAGSYAVQGMGTIFIDKIDGSYTNVMGFPLETFLKELPQFSNIPLYHWFL